MANEKYTKNQIVQSEKYKDFYVLQELLKDDKQYTLKEVNAMLKVYGKEV